MKVKWWTIPNNFGDVLTPYVLDYFGIKHQYVERVDDADALCVGSIARLALPNQKVFGSGVIRKNELSNPSVDWKFVRGPLTRDNVLRCGGTCPEIYGDPALLLPLFCEESKKKHKVGIVPHYQHYNKGLFNSSHFVIDIVRENPLEVAREISSCEKIISSSLHGIIAAHAYGIPAAWVGWTKLHGDGIKFHDYFQSVGIKSPVISTINNPVYMEAGSINLDYIKETFEKEI